MSQWGRSSVHLHSRKEASKYLWTINIVLSTEPAPLQNKPTK